MDMQPEAAHFTWKSAVTAPQAGTFMQIIVYQKGFGRLDALGMSLCPAVALRAVLSLARIKHSQEKKFSGIITVVIA